MQSQIVAASILRRRTCNAPETTFVNCYPQVVAESSSENNSAFALSLRNVGFICPTCPKDL